MENGIVDFVWVTQPPTNLFKDYLRIFTMEQLQARVQPKQASPFFIDKLYRLVGHIKESMKSPNLTPTQRFILARDQAFFKAVFFSGDRPGDMGQVKVPEILRFPNNDGLLFNHVWGKLFEMAIPIFLVLNATLKLASVQFGVLNSILQLRSNLRSI